MMSPSIRPYEPRDLDALYAISLATGLAGEDASHLYEDPKLIGQIYSAPYATLEPDFVLVAEDRDGVAGYVLGVPDSRAWAQRLERDWWPALRARHPDPSDVPAESHSPDQRRAFMIHHPEQPPCALTDAYPAHIHMNLLPRLQGRGVGPRLLQAWIAKACAAGVTAAHIGTNRANQRASGFWRSQGFEELGLPEMPPTRTLWLGRRFGGEATP